MLSQLLLGVTIHPVKIKKITFMTIRSSFRLRVYSGNIPAIGPGKIALLEAILEYGSIRAAAKSLGMSYNRAWLLIEELNECFKKPVVETLAGGAKGGGTQITKIGHQLIEEYRSIEKEAQKATAKRIKVLSAMLKK
jgi:molybdate transport system regulatory protein